MKSIALLALLSVVWVTGGCAGVGGAETVHVGPDPQAGQGFRAVAHVNGDFAGQTFAYAVPTSALVKAHGDFTVTLRAFPAPFLVIDGDSSLIVEPLPGKEEEAVRAVRSGFILIRRNGVAGDLNPVGSAAKSASTVPVSFPMPSMIPNEPAREPANDGPPAGSPPPSPVAIGSSDPCSGGKCCVPPPCR